MSFSDNRCLTVQVAMGVPMVRDDDRGTIRAGSGAASAALIDEYGFDRL